MFGPRIPGVSEANAEYGNEGIINPLFSAKLRKGEFLPAHVLYHTLLLIS